MPLERKILERIVSELRDTYQRTFGAQVTNDQLLESLDRLIEKQSRFLLDDKLGSLRSPRDLTLLKEIVLTPEKPKQEPKPADAKKPRAAKKRATRKRTSAKPDSK